MAGALTQIIGGLYKRVYEDHVSEQTMKRYPLRDIIKWEQVDFAGSDVTYNAHVEGNVSPMWAGEDSAFADAGNQSSIQIRIGQRKLMARVRASSEALEDSMKSVGAWRSARSDEMTRIKDDIARMEEYSVTSDGRGVLALVDDTTPSGSTTVTLDAPGGITGDNFGNRFCRKGMYVAFVNPATGAMRTGIDKITACSSDGTSITLDGACDAGVADNDYVVQAANSSVTDVLDTSYEHAAWGLMALFDDGTYRSNYFNADRSVHTQFQTYVNASTGAISEDLLQRMADIVAQRLDTTINMMFMHHSIRRLFIQMTQADRRYQGDNLQKPDAGTGAFTQGDLTFGGVTLRAIRTFPLATILGIDTNAVDFRQYGSSRGKWVDDDGSVWVRVGSGTSARDSFEAWFRKRYQNHVRYPGKAFRLDGITGQTLVVVREAGT